MVYLPQFPVCLLSVHGYICSIVSMCVSECSVVAFSAYCYFSYQKPYTLWMCGHSAGLCAHAVSILDYKGLARIVVLFIV